VQAAYDALVPSRDGDVTAGRPITVVGGEHPRDTDLASLRRLEAQELAALIHRVRAEGWPVARRDPDGGEHIEPARYADIAVLLPTRATLPYLEQALDDARIPARIESQSLVYATAEVQELLAVLTAIDDPADEVAIVAALRAPAFACRDDKLAEFRAAGGRWDYRADVPPQLPPTHPVVMAMHSLHALHERRWWDTVSETVERVIRERRLMELAVARARPRDHWRRIRFVADAARAFRAPRGSSCGVTGVAAAARPAHQNPDTKTIKIQNKLVRCTIASNIIASNMSGDTPGGVPPKRRWLSSKARG
jgi:ATP-dependent helicase/nuclease subunit A